MALNRSAHHSDTPIWRRTRRAALTAGLACGLLLTLASAAGAVTFSNPTPIVISTAAGPATPYPSPITVAGLTGTTTKVTVRLNGFSHTFPGDVNVVLVPPSGTNILLMGRAGGAPPVSNINLTFDGASTAQLPTTGLTTGTFRPTARGVAAPFPAPGPGSFFCNPGPAVGGTACTGPDNLGEAFNGFDPNGQWRLFVTDVFTNDGGEFAGGWTLDITAGGGPQRTLTVSNPVTGSGTLTGSGMVTGSGITCGADCASSYASGTVVTLTAAPTVGSNFAGFTGCTSTGPTTCTVTIDGAKSVTANFAANPPQNLNVTTTGSGTGVVAGTGINCGTDCAESYNGGTPVVLTAGPSVAGSRFIGWTGCDSVSGNSCTLTMTSAKNVTATFTQGTDPVPPVVTPPAPAPVPAPAPAPLPVIPPDRTAPTVTLSVPSSMSRAAFLKGVKVRVKRNERSSIEATLQATARRVTLAAAFNTSLASRTTPRATGTTVITLKPSRALVGRARTLRARVRVVVTDASGNRRTMTKLIRVTR